MQENTALRNNLQHLVAAAAVALSSFGLTFAQTNSASETQVISAPGNKTGADQEEESRVVALDRYVVKTDQDQGYLSKSTVSSAGRISTPILDTPQLIEVANRELLQDLNADAMLTAVQTVAGGISNRSYNVGDDQYIWGFRTWTLRDGIPLGGYAVGLMYDVDRVEVLKGPVAMTYGYAGFVGGAINYVTRAPSSTPTTDVQATVGSFNYYRGEVHWSRPITQKFRYRLDIGATHSDYSPRKFGFYKDAFVGGSFDYAVSPTTDLKVDASYSYISYNRPFTFFDPLTHQLFNGPDDFAINPSATKYPQRTFRTSATLTNNLGNGFGMRLFVGYYKVKMDWLQTYATGYDPATGIMQRAAEFYSPRQDQITQTLDFSKSLVTGPLKHTVTFGESFANFNFNYDDASLATTALNVYAPGDGGTVTTVRGTGPHPYDVHRQGTSRAGTAYIQDVISIFDNRAYLIGGLRDNSEFSNDPSSQDKIVVRYGAIYKPTKSISLYAIRSQAFDFNTGSIDYLGNAFHPSTGNEREAGVKVDLLDGQISLSGAWFDVRYTNIYTLFLQGPNDPRPGAEGISQGGANTNKGYELSASINTKQKGSGQFNMIGTIFSGNMRNEFGLKPNGAVNNTGSLLVKYRLLEGGLRGLAFGAGMIYEGTRFGNNYPDGSRTVQPAYTTYNAFATYTRGRFRYQFNVDNISGKRFVAGMELYYWVFTNPGRTVKFSVGYKF